MGKLKPLTRVKTEFGIGSIYRNAAMKGYYLVLLNKPSMIYGKKTILTTCKRNEISVIKETKCRYTLTRFERETLKELCINNECSIETLIDALMNNTVSEPLSQQIAYLQTGKLPE